jgi:hypothetical protein
MGEIALRPAVNSAASSLAATRPARTLRWRQATVLSFATIALWLALLDLPGPAGNSLDGAWNTSLIDAHLHGRQFGPDVIFTYGPWGFLNSVGYLAPALHAKFLWEIGGKFALSLTAILLTGSLRGFRRWLFVGALVAYAHYFDSVASVLLVLLTLGWLVPARVPFWQRVLAVAWLAFLAHFKFVLCLQAVTSIAIVGAIHIAEGKWRNTFLLTGGFVLAYTAGWLAAGQRLANLPTFWRLSFEISRGYSWAMGVDPSPAILFLAAVVVVFAAAFLWMIWRSGRPGAERAGAVLIVAISGFVAWKQGFTRADEHGSGSFSFACCSASSSPAFLPRAISFIGAI